MPLHLFEIWTRLMKRARWLSEYVCMWSNTSKSMSKSWVHNGHKQHTVQTELQHCSYVSCKIPHHPLIWCLLSNTKCTTWIMEIISFLQLLGKFDELSYHICVVHLPCSILNTTRRLTFFNGEVPQASATLVGFRFSKSRHKLQKKQNTFWSRITPWKFMEV